MTHQLNHCRQAKPANSSCSKHREIAGAKDQLDEQDHSITISMPLIRGILLATPSLETGSGIDADLSISSLKYRMAPAPFQLRVRHKAELWLPPLFWPLHKETKNSPSQMHTGRWTSSWLTASLPLFPS